MKLFKECDFRKKTKFPVFTNKKRHQNRYYCQFCRSICKYEPNLFNDLKLCNDCFLKEGGVLK